MDETRRLWGAVLIQAIKDLAGFSTDDEQERRRLQHYAALWFASDSQDPGSFIWICDGLRLSPSWIRRRIRASQLTREELGNRLRVALPLAVIQAGDHEAECFADAMRA